MKNLGLKPYYRKSKKDYSYHRTFGSPVVPQFPLEKNVDAGLTNENQEQTSICTAETVTDIKTDENKIPYSVDWQYAQTLRLMGVPATYQGGDLKTAFSVPIAVGLLLKSEAPFTFRDYGQSYIADWRNWPNYPQVESRRKGAYLFLYDSELDWFDDVRNFINKNNRSVGIGSPWYAEYEWGGKDGIMPKGINQISWHAWKACGWKNINGKAYLICKSWQGENYMDKGFAYFSREEFNRIMDIRGSSAMVFCDVDPNDIKVVKWGILERWLGLLQELLSFKK